MILAAGACGTDVTGPSASVLSCVFGEARAVDVGDVLQVRGEGHWDLCLQTPEPAEYLYVPFYASTDTTGKLPVSLTGAGLASQAGTGGSGLDPAVLSSALRPAQTFDGGFHAELRRREIRELEPRIRPGAPSSDVALDPVAASVAADVPTTGDLRDFNVEISCTDTDMRTGRVTYVSDHAVIYADTANPTELSAADFEYFGATFDTLIYPVETGHFGAPTDIDQNGHQILFFTRAVNERNPHGSDSESVTIGFFWSGDLFPVEETPRLEACPESNHSEMFYLISPDPTGQAGVPFSVEAVRNLAIPLIGHEFQHLINASRRLFVNQATAFEAPWLNEGLSHIAEELLYYEVSGLGPGRNLNADSVLAVPGEAEVLFRRFMGANTTNLARYLSRPDTASLMGPPNELATRGASWHFLRYTADRSEMGDSAFFFDLVNGTVAGVENLNSVLGSGEALSWMHDWTVTLFADDNVPGVAPRFQLPSWDLRSIGASNLGSYPLRVTALANDAASGFDLPPGGAAFNLFDVAADARAVVHVEAGRGTPPSSLRGSFLRTR